MAASQNYPTIKALIRTEGVTLEQTFTASVKEIYTACLKHLGRCYKTTLEDGKILWNFNKGSVELSGDVHVKVGYRSFN